MAVLRVVLAVIVGVAIGSLVNMAIILAGSSIIAAPAGVDVSDSESIAASMHLFEVKHFIFPFLAHAIGTFVGALVGGYLGWQRRILIVLAVAILSFAGGVSVSFMIPAPVAFIVADLTLAYFPMALLALWALNGLTRKDGGSGQS